MIDSASRIRGESFERLLMFRCHVAWMLAAAMLVGCQGQPAPTDAELLAQAKLALRSTAPLTAIPPLETLLQRQPTHAEALLFRAQLAREERDDARALELVRRVPAERGPIGGTARYLEGSLLVAQGDLDGAETAFRQAIDWHPGYRPARIGLVELLFLEMRGEAARAALSDWKRVLPWSLTEYVQYQLALTDQARPDGSRDTLQRFLKRSPHHEAVLIAYARDCLLANDLDAARTTLEPAVAAAPKSDELRGMLQETLVRAGELTAAERLTQGAFPAVTTTVGPWRGFGLLADARADWPAAALAWWHVVRRVPDDRQAHYRLAVALERAGQSEAAQTQFQRTRRVEVLLNHLTHILAGDVNQKHLVAQMAERIAELLLELQRPAEARLWIEYLTASAPQSPGIPSLIQRLQQIESAPQPDDPDLVLGQQLTAAAIASRKSPATTPTLKTATPEFEHSTTVPIRLVDRHAEAGLTFQHFNGPTANKYLLESLGGAVAVLDYDGDGWADFYFPQGCRIPFDPEDTDYTDRLYRNRCDGTFVDVTEQTTIFENGYSQGVAAGDFDNDGFPDLVIANYGKVSFFRNLGDGTYQNVSSRLDEGGTHWSSSVAWADLNRDGLLDLYVVNYVYDAQKVCRTPSGALAACSPGNFEAEPDLVWLNAGDGSFRPLPLKQAGLDGAEGKGLGILISDLDDDGWPDIYISNDGTPNFLFRHTGHVEAGIPQFLDSGFVSGAAVSGDGRSQAGMGIASADFTGTQRFDLYVTNFHNDYNTLYHNLGEGLFEDRTAAANLVAPTMNLLGFGTQAVDFDGNSWPDLVIANGHIDDFRSTGVPWKMPLQLFQNRGGGRWEEVGQASGGPFIEGALGRAVAQVDWNRDARPDVVAVFQDRPIALITNETAVTGKSLVLKLIGRTTNRDAIGTRITVTAGGRTLIRELTGGDGYFATNERRLVIGLGGANKVDRLDIRWGSGLRQSWEGIEPEGLMLHEGDESPIREHLDRRLVPN